MCGAAADIFHCKLIHFGLYLALFFLRLPRAAFYSICISIVCIRTAPLELYELGGAERHISLVIISLFNSQSHFISNFNPDREWRFFFLARRYSFKVKE
jgi:hypothetical protein